jgi:hypothetical protein
MNMEDDKEKVTYKIMFRGSKSLEIGQTITTRINYVSEGEDSHGHWREGMVEDLVVKINPNPCGRRIFFNKREW